MNNPILYFHQQDNKQVQKGKGSIKKLNKPTFI